MLYKVPTFVKVQSATCDVMDARVFGIALSLRDTGDAPIDDDRSRLGLYLTWKGCGLFSITGHGLTGAYNERE